MCNLDFEALALSLRKEAFLAAQNAGAAHIAPAFSIIEIVAALYFGGVMNINAENPFDENRDYLYLSKGHGSLALYAALYKKGFFDKKTLYSFATKDSILGSEPDTLLIPGVEATTGSLGHGLSLACGAAFAAKLDGKTNRFFCILGDGECQEGTVWEAVIFASARNLNNLTIIVDDNKLQKVHSTEFVAGKYSLADKFRSFGMQTVHADGHNVRELIEVLNKKTDVPLVVIADTVKGKGVSVMENKPLWHYKMPSAKEMTKFMQELGITQEELQECKELL